jgi:hypothetical protein
MIMMNFRGLRAQKTRRVAAGPENVDEKSPVFRYPSIGRAASMAGDQRHHQACAERTKSIEATMPSGGLPVNQRSEISPRDQADVGSPTAARH